MKQPLPFVFFLLGLLAAPLTLAQEVLWGTTSREGATGGIAFSVSSTGADFRVRRDFPPAIALPSLLQADQQGNIYGTAGLLGNFSSGQPAPRVLCKITPSGSRQVLRYLEPDEQLLGLLPTRSGSLYGVASLGYQGPRFFYHINPDGSEYQILRHFTGSEGGSPQLEGMDGYFYGMTNQGGDQNYGTVFRLSADGADYQVLHHFSGGRQGSYPEGTLTQGPDGSLYGVCYGGEGNPYVTVYRLNPDGGEFTVLKSFAYPEGVRPAGNLLLARNGILYGTAPGGIAGYGILFAIYPDLYSEGSRMAVLKHFTGGDTDTAYPGALLEGPDGDLYGAARGGSYGRIFTININTGEYQVLYTFSFREPPYTHLLLGQNGAIYGNAGFNGIAFLGSVFGIGPTNGFSSTYFTRRPAPTPAGGLSQSPDGGMYGLVSNAETYFRLDTAGHYRPTFLSSGTSLQGSLTSSAQGTFFGVTHSGGNYGKGSLMAFHPDSSGDRTLKHFAGGDEGAYPRDQLLQASDGTLYGVTDRGGSADMGTLYSINSDGTGYQVVKSFTGTDGAGPQGGLVLGSDGAIYGVTYSGGDYEGGVIFRLQPQNNHYTILKHLSGDGQGGFLSGGLLRGTDEQLYGVSAYGGEYGWGTIYRISLEGEGFQVLHSFTGSEGSIPKGPLVQGQTGILYGVTEWGGKANRGTLFSINPDGSGFSLLKSFTPGEGTPYSNLVVEPMAPLTATARVAAAGSAPAKASTSPGRIWPNPVEAQLTLQLSGSVGRIESLTISDVSGRVYTCRPQLLNGQLLLEVVDLRPGLYLLHLQTEQGYQVLKFIKR